MKIEVEIDEKALADEVRGIAANATKGLFRDNYNLTHHGKQVAAAANARVAEMIASGEVQALIAETAKAETTNVVKELTVAEVRKAVRAELKAMKERGQLELS